ncbi:MAG: hypothetical protein ACRDLO_05020 [Solirubrobacterales bacterium]
MSGIGADQGAAIRGNFGLGRLAADDVLDGEPRLEPFRLSRFERGATHIPSRGPYPWT